MILDFPATDSLHVGMANGFEVEEDGTIIYILHGQPVVMRRSDKTVLYQGPDDSAHHSITKTPQGTLMFLAAGLKKSGHGPNRVCSTGGVVMPICCPTGTCLSQIPRLVS